MKAAVLHKFGDTPRFEEFPEPPIEKGQLLVHVKAVALENIDKALANGNHFSVKQMLPQLPAIIGLDGIGSLEDGRLIGFGGIKSPYGALAERTVIQENYFVPVPEGIDPIIAAALPAPALTALFPLKWGAKLQAGETVLINGATGVTGILAIQIAKHLGAGRIVCTGRHDETLKSLIELGADATIDLKLSGDELAKALSVEAEKGFDVILDCLWGHPTEMIIKSLIPNELGFAKRRVRLIQVGEMAGQTINLSADSLRTSGLEMIGASAGLTPEAIGEGTAMIWDLLREGKLHLDIIQMPLSEIETAWKRTDLHGKRIVIVP